jgi:hypothetical protein
MLLMDSLLQLTTSGNDLLEDIVVVTGQGRGSTDGPVLQSEVPLFLQDKLGLETSPVAGNPGRFVVKGMALLEWIKSNEGAIQ